MGQLLGCACQAATDCIRSLLYALIFNLYESVTIEVVQLNYCTVLWQLELELEPCIVADDHWILSRLARKLCGVFADVCASGDATAVNNNTDGHPRWLHIRVRAHAVQCSLRANDNANNNNYYYYMKLYVHSVAIRLQRIAWSEKFVYLDRESKLLRFIIVHVPRFC